MGSYPLLTAAAVALVALGALGACSSGTGSAPSATSAPASTTSTASETHTPAPGAVEISPGGVTTGVGAPAESTEDEYFEACKVAKVWMDQHGGDPKSQIEPYLASLQSSDSAGPGTFGTPWSKLAPARQSAAIVAVQAAADALCG
jgi:hypothetical protein